MPYKVGYISGSAKHHHKVHILVEVGPMNGPPDEHAGGEYEVHWAVTACGLDSRTASKKRWMALVLGPKEEPTCATCIKKTKGN